MDSEYGNIPEGYGELYSNYMKMDDKPDCEMFLDFVGQNDQKMNEIKSSSVAENSTTTYQTNLQNAAPLAIPVANNCRNEVSDRTSSDAETEFASEAVCDSSSLNTTKNSGHVPESSVENSNGMILDKVFKKTASESPPNKNGVNANHLLETNIPPSNPSEKDDVKEVCRVCMHPSDILVSMFDKCPSQSFFIPSSELRQPDIVTGRANIWYDDQTIRDKIKFCSSVQVLETEKLSSVICKPCLSDLLVAYKFKKRLEASDEIFRKKLGLTSKTIVKTEFVLIDCDGKEDNRDWDSSESDDQPLAQTQKKIKTKFKKEKEKKREKHDKTKHEEKIMDKLKYKCEKCDKRFQYPSMLRYHQVAHDKPRKRGRQPGFTLKKKSPLEEREMRGRVLQTPPPPDDIKFDGPKGTQIKPRKCSTCDKQFYQLKYLRMHERSHMQIYPCEACSEQFTSLINLNLHHKAFHADLKCPRCGRVFQNNVSFQKHLENHKNDRSVSRIVEDSKVKSTADLFKTIAPITTTYWSDSFSD